MLEVKKNFKNLSVSVLLRFPLQETPRDPKRLQVTKNNEKPKCFNTFKIDMNSWKRCILLYEYKQNQGNYMYFLKTIVFSAMYLNLLKEERFLRYINYNLIYLNVFSIFWSIIISPQFLIFHNRILNIHITHN